MIGYNFNIDDGTESKFGTHKELTVLNILKYEYCQKVEFDRPGEGSPE